MAEKNNTFVYLNLHVFRFVPATRRMAGCTKQTKKLNLVLRLRPCESAPPFPHTSSLCGA